MEGSIMRKGIDFLTIFMVVWLATLLVVSHLMANPKNKNSLSKLEIIQKVQKLHVPFVANEGQVDERFVFYAETFGGTVFVTKDCEIGYSLPRIEKGIDYQRENKIPDGNQIPLESYGALTNIVNCLSPLKYHANFYEYAGFRFLTQPTKITEQLTNSYRMIQDPSPIETGDLQSTVLSIREEFVGGKILRIKGEGESITKVNYFKGNAPSKWMSNISTYEIVNLGEVYKGIELKLKAYGNNVEKLFYVKPGTNPESIQIRLSNVNTLKINEKGQLEAETALGIITFTKPIAYQEIEGERVEVPVEYILLNAERDASQLLTSASSTSGSSTINPLTTQPIYGFKIASYDKTKVVVIDPLLASTYLGGTYEDEGFSITSDSNGNVYLTGFTKPESDFPITDGAFDISYNGGHYSNTSGDAFIAKLNKDLTKLLASTYLGGSGKDSARSIVVDLDGNIYVSGHTESSNFPTTFNAYDSSYNGGGGNQWNEGEGGDVFVSKLNGDLSKLLASTYLGGSRGDKSFSIAKDKGGNIYLTGVTKSSNFPTTPDAYIQYLIGGMDVFISKLSGDLSRLLASTYLGGSDSDIAYSMSFGLDESIYVAGQTSSSDFPAIPNNYDISYNNGNTDAFVSKLSADLTKLLASTYLGGSSDDECRSIAIDSNGDVYMTGSTLSPNFPTTSKAYDNSFNGEEDVFISKLSNDLTKLLASTYLGGSSGDAGYAMAIDSNENIYLTGPTVSSDFPTTSHAYDNSFNGGNDVFVAKLSNDLMKLLASTYLGGDAKDYSNFIGINSNGNIYLTGWTVSSDFPTTKNAYDTSVGGRLYGDAFISKFDNTLSVLPPVVMTGPVKILTPNSTKLNGIVNANDSSTKVWFEYGMEKGSYNSTSSTQTIAGSNDTKISIGISGLSAGTAYYYRIVAQNNVGTTYGNERTFVQEFHQRSVSEGALEKKAHSEETKKEIPYLQKEGRNAIEDQNWNTAVYIYKKLLEIDPENYVANIDIGIAYAMLNEFDLSIKHLTKANQLEPTRYWPYYIMSAAYARKGDKDHAIEFFQKAIDRGILNIINLKTDVYLPEDFKQDPKFKKLINQP